MVISEKCFGANSHQFIVYSCKYNYTAIPVFRAYFMHNTVKTYMHPSSSKITPTESDNDGNKNGNRLQIEYQPDFIWDINFWFFLVKW